MTREDLKGIVEGIGDEQLKCILDINTADIGKAKGDFAALQAENDTLKAAKQELEGKINDLSEKSSTADDYKKQLEELKSEMREKEKAAKAEAEDKALTEAIEALFGDREPTSEYIRTGLIADMKKEIAKPENKGKGYGAIFESLTEGVEGLFKNPNPPADMPGLGAAGAAGASDSAMRAAMGLTPNKE